MIPISGNVGFVKQIIGVENENLAAKPSGKQRGIAAT
jgi:hypothetical protein